MYLVSRQCLQNYLTNDRTNRLLDELSQKRDEALVCQRWLRQTPPKRFIFEKLYGDLLTAGPRRRVLDVGGGLTAFTRELARRHDYTLLDLLAHDQYEVAKEMSRQVGRDFISVVDWRKYRPVGNFDIVIANDLFPNVDQRLDMFLNHFLSQSALMRLSLTFYNVPRFYLTRRVDADEIFYMLAWDGSHTRSVLAKFADRIVQLDLDVLEKENESLYSNGRQVCLVEFLGDKAL